MLKADLQSANFSPANGTYCQRMLSFQSSYEANEVWIIVSNKIANHDKKG